MYAVLIMILPPTDTAVIVSQREYLFNSFYCSKERQSELLLNDGVKIIQENETGRYRIKDFKYRRFDVKNFQITVLKTNAQILEEYTKFLQEKSSKNLKKNPEVY